MERPVIVITRMFDAPRALVWFAITDPKNVAEWYGGPGFTNPVCEMDLRPGGAWHHVMQSPNGMRFTINSIFEEVVAPERLVWRTVKDPNRNPAPVQSSLACILASSHGLAYTFGTNVSALSFPCGASPINRAARPGQDLH
jgi:uncharacterized protein YndB with AHSA1/START domain